METQNQLTTKTSGAVSNYKAPPMKQEILASEISIPRIHIMQGSSDLVKAGKAVAGDVVKLPSGTKLVARTGHFNIVPLCYTQTWRIEEQVGKKYVWKGTEARTAANDDLPWEFTREGTNWRRTKVQEFFVLIPTEIAKEVKALAALAKGEFADPDDALLPCVLSFSGLAIKTGGKEISSFLAKCQQFSAPLFINQFKIGITEAKNANGDTWWRYTVDKADKTPSEYFDVCAKWQAMIGKGAVQVIDVEEDAPVVAKPASSKGDEY